ncbi:MAG: anti-sigma factor domain-containing protein [Actinomycetes bacterium]
MSTDLHTLSGAYALDALSPEEATAFRTHLAACPACCQEVRELRSAAARMGASEAVPPPPYLKARVLDAANRTPQLPPRVSGLHAARRSRWSPKLVAAAAAAVMVVGTAIGVGVTVGEPDGPTLAQGVVEVFTAPDARSVEVETTHGPLKVATSRSEGEMAVDTSSLVPLDEEHVYQVWTVVEGEPLPVAVLDEPDAGAHMGMPAPGTQVAITVEPAGGSPKPTTDPIAQLDPSTV